MAVEYIKGSTDTFTAIAYGRPDPLTLQWCNQRMENFRQSLVPEAQAFFNRSEDSVFGAINYDGVSRMVKAMSDRVDVFWMDDVFRQLLTIDDLRKAPDTMIPYVMSHPEIHALYKANEIAGYDEHYQEAMREDDEVSDRYQETINGIWLPTNNPDKPDEERATFYLEDYDDSTLDLSDRASIMDAWELTLYHISQRKEDPTSTYNAML